MTSITSVHVRFAVDEAFELRKEVLDRERHKKRKVAKRLRKSRRTAAKEQKKRENEEVEYMFRFMCHMDDEERNRIIYDPEHERVNILRVIFPSPNRDHTIDAFEKVLADFGKGKYKVGGIPARNFRLFEALLEDFRGDGTYTALDRFLQHLFSYDDERLLQLGRGGMQDFLRLIYPRSGNPQEEFLKRNLTEAKLREMDEAAARANRVIPLPVDRVLETGGGESNPVDVKPQYPPSTYVRVGACKSLERALEREGQYQTATADDGNAVAATSSSDASSDATGLEGD